VERSSWLIARYNVKNPAGVFANNESNNEVFRQVYEAKKRKLATSKVDLAEAESEDQAVRDDVVGPAS
jgi:hypothetical protein